MPNCLGILSVNPKTPEQSTSDDASRYQAIIDAAQGKPSMEAIRAYISQEPLLKTAAERQANIDGLWQMLTQLTPEQIHGIGADENILKAGSIFRYLSKQPRRHRCFTCRL